MDRILEAQEDDFELRFKLSDSYCVYGADDIKVEIEDGWIEVKAELIEQHPDEIIRHSFYRKRKLPAEVIVESLSCDIDQGMLIISGKKQLPEKRVLKVNVLRSGP
uniref:SHSP domain-containing protein n=1 Tax=Acrobeloides nanus TaxID=290746 RepID=A0A914EDU7_9BILA